MGGAWFLDRLWRKLGIDTILQHRLKERQHCTEVKRALFAMVANQVLAPLSKLQLEKCA